MEFHGWELKKALKMLKGSNPGLLEWLRSNSYRKETIFYVKAVELMNSFRQNSALVFHYINMARKHYDAYFKVRKREEDQCDKQVLEF